MFGLIAGLTLFASTTSAEPPSTIKWLKIEQAIETRTIALDESLKKTADISFLSTTTLSEHYSEKYGVNLALSEKIIKCESGFDRYIQNPNSSAQGYWQFIDSTWEHTMELMNMPTSTPKTDYPISLEAGFFLLGKDGTRHWLESKPCWNK